MAYDPLTDILNQPTAQYVSTPEPYDVPRWGDEQPSPQLALSPPPSYQPKLSLVNVMGSYKPPEAAGMNAATSTPSGGGSGHSGAYSSSGGVPSNSTYSGGTNTNYTGGWMPSAYGVKGKTGQANEEGKAPFGLQPEFWQRLTAANTAMKQAGLGTFGVTDGFRSYSSQVDLKQRKPGLAATPGNSVHGTGYAADLDITDAQADWLYKNGPKYGIAAPLFQKENWHFQLIPSLKGQPVGSSGEGWRSTPASYFGGPDELQPVADSKHYPGGTAQLNAQGPYYVASRDLPMGTQVEVQFGGKTLPAVVADWGPNIKTGRDIDLGYNLAQALGYTQYGNAPVMYRVAPKPNLSLSYPRVVQRSIAPQMLAAERRDSRDTSIPRAVAQQQFRDYRAGERNYTPPVKPRPEVNHFVGTQPGYGGRSDR